MCVVAHPDDECFAFGGALALAADRGVETYVLCMTDGQAARHRGDAASNSQLGATRRAEFAASCKVLGVATAELLGYQDGQLMAASMEDAANQIVQRMRLFRPHAVVTFGGDGGMNSHADHMAVSFLATTAFHWAGQENRSPEMGRPWQPERLFYATTDAFLPDRRPPMPAPWTVTLDLATVRERKNEAFRQHLSQAPLMEATRDFFREHGAREHYTLAAARHPGPAAQWTDLLEGL
jgi:LmbE family N-acetylglucosaminyl deacetylase